MKFRGHSAALCAAALLAGCAASPTDEARGVEASPWAARSLAYVRMQPLAPRWRHLTFPGKAMTAFHYSRTDGRDALAAVAASSASMLRSAVRVEPAELGSVRFSWKVPALIAGADVALRDADDSPVRIVLFFEGDRSRFSPKDALLSELVRSLTGEEMPYATLMYVWCNGGEPGAVIPSPRTSRVRSVVVESGTRNLGQWLDYERNIRADYHRAFGETPGALVGIGVMSDSDNTRSTARAWYGPLRLETSAPVNY